MLLNFDHAIIQSGGETGMFTDDNVTVEDIKNKIKTITASHDSNIKTITNELARLVFIEKEHGEHVALIAQKDEELRNNAVEKQQLTSSIDELNKEIEALKAQITAGVSDKSALEALQRQISELQAKEKESERTIQMLDEKDVKTTKELQELTDKYNKLKESRDLIFQKNKEIILKYKEKLSLADELFEKYDQIHRGIKDIASPIDNKNNFNQLPETP
jgi:chromosome segregation ATPase